MKRMGRERRRSRVRKGQNSGCKMGGGGGGRKGRERDGEKKGSRTGFENEVPEFEEYTLRLDSADSLSLLPLRTYSHPLRVSLLFICFIRFCYFAAVVVAIRRVVFHYLFFSLARPLPLAIILPRRTHISAHSAEWNSMSRMNI